MNVQLQKAVTALRAGNKSEAQVLLAKVIRDEPKNAHAWFLLSSLAESKEKQIAFAKKVLAIDPDHVGAQKRLSQLADHSTAVAPATKPAPEPPASTAKKVESQPKSEALVLETNGPSRSEPKPEPIPQRPLPVSEKSDDFLSQAEAETLPPWLAGEEMSLVTPDSSLPSTPDRASTAVSEPEQLPDWLQEQPAKAWMETKQADKGQVVWHATQAEEPSAPPPPAVKKSPPSKTTKSKTDAPAPVTSILIGLSVLTVVVAVLLVYIVLTTFL